MLSIALRREQHTRQYAISASQPSGWELTLQEDLERIKRVHFEDWHRVERAIAVVRLEIEDLRSRGWKVEDSHGKLLQT
jgi:hypothetical protein